MPFNVKVIEGAFSPEQKQDMVRRLTGRMVDIEGANMRPGHLRGRRGSDER